jgi:hypothetical protein
LANDPSRVLPVGDRRRELYLSQEIERMQDEKIAALKNSREAKGLEKTVILDHFLKLDKEQKVMEIELERLQDEV